MPGILSYIRSKKMKVLVLSLMMAGVATAQNPRVPNTMENPLAQFMLFIMILLLLAIGVLAQVVIGAAHVRHEKLLAEKNAEKKNDSPGPALVLIPFLLLISAGAFAQDAIPATVADESINGLSKGTFYTMIAVILLEILVILVLIYQLKSLLGIQLIKKKAVVEIPGVPKVSWWDRINRSIAIEKEKDIDLNHEYDGIRELDNRIPPWWLAGFIFFIVFGMGYLWRYHVAQSAPLQIEEFKIAMEKAEEEKAAYLAKSANLVDETNVKMMDEAGVASGKALFTQHCVVCHGPEGQGASVGPNLADTYWLHGGKMQDVFKSIKYGWPDKGMRSWQEDLSPMQMAQLASFVRSLQGSNPANPKEAQGELFAESVDEKTPDSISTAPSIAK